MTRFIYTYGMITAIRYIANAAGGLLPVLAESLKKTFHKAVILTSYGMTECMPIASPPQTYKLDPIGTSGSIVGPDLIIADDNKNQLEINKVGNILIRGPPCFGGYENNTVATDDAFCTCASPVPKGCHNSTLIVALLRFCNCPISLAPLLRPASFCV